MNSKDDGVDMVEVKFLRIGMFVELDVGWLAHPFPTGSFKISSNKQIETIRGLGLERVRVDLSRSDPDPEELAAQAQTVSVSDTLTE